MPEETNINPTATSATSTPPIEVPSPVETTTPPLTSGGASPALPPEPVTPPPAPAAPVVAPPVPEPTPTPPPEPAAENPIKRLLAKALAKIQFRKQAKLEKIMVIARQSGQVTNDDAQKLLRVSDATATRYLAELVKTGRLRRVGHPRHASYQPVP